MNANGENKILLSKEDRLKTTEAWCSRKALWEHTCSGSEVQRRAGGCRLSRAHGGSADTHTHTLARGHT